MSNIESILQIVFRLNELLQVAGDHLCRPVVMAVHCSQRRLGRRLVVFALFNVSIADDVWGVLANVGFFNEWLHYNFVENSECLVLIKMRDCLILRILQSTLQNFKPS